MFRVTAKKKKKKTVTRLRADSDDEKDTPSSPPRNKADDPDENDNNSVDGDSKLKRVKDKSKKSKKKKKGLVVRSFDVGEGHDADEGSSINESSKKSKKRKRQGGIGFGGGAAKLMVHDDDDEMNFPTNEDDSVKEKSTYGKDALEKLKQEQKYKASVDKEEKKAEPPLSSAPSPDEKFTINDRDNAASPSLGEYVSLNGKEPSVILTGDEALEFDNRRNDENDQKGIQPEDHFNSVMEESHMFDTAENQQQAREASAWEAEITRRAGLSNGQKSASQSQSNGQNSSGAAGASSATSLVKLRDQFQSTIAHLENQMSDMDRACERRRVELSQTQSELERQENELKEAGQALNEYQQLREDVTFWTGALRHLQQKVQPIQDALIDLDADIANPTKQRDWEDDMCAILHQAGLLDRVLGRQPPDFVFESTTTYVDEFGRDVKSQHAMSREKRIRRLLEIQNNRNETTNDNDLDALIDAHDVEIFQERRVALGRALDVALDDLEEEYTSLPLLASIFHKWQQSYKDDFKQCYANLSLGDLASVLVQVELCKIRPPDATYNGWLEGLNHGQETPGATFGWMGELVSDQNNGSKTNGATSMPADDLIDRVIEKSYCPVLDNLLDKSAYDVASTKQSCALSVVYAQLCKLVGSRNHLQFGALTRKMFDYLKSSLDNTAIAVLNSTEPPNIKEEDDDGDNRYMKKELQLALDGSIEGQLRRITKMLVNIIKYWSPLMSTQEGGSDVVEFLLDFLSSKYLFLLSSLRGRSEKTTQAFTSVWNVLQATQWLDQPGRMLQAAPIRAAVVAFKMD